ncbi:MAG: hypothetical protein PHS14_12790 [Elusimicrobia bacterium]|nr:hypothetical protein [Elusimicrobiota bacterium]
MRILKGFRLILALAFAAVSARAAAPISLVVPGLSWAPAACPLILPAAAAGFAPALSVSPAGLVPSLLPLPAPASPLAVSPSAVGPAARPSIIRSLGSVPAAGDAPGSDGAAKRYAGFFDGVVPPADGEAVYPRLAVGEGSILRRPLQLDAVRNAVRLALPALRESVALGGWNGPRTTLDESCCGDAAPKLALLLRAQGIPARLVEAEFHYYVILDLPGGQIVVDPTVRQFFGKKRAPETIPHVFVGTIGDLTSFFQRHAASKTTRYDPQRIYFRESVVREDALRAFEAKVRDGGAAEHDPLRRFLGLPPAAPRPPGVPRLIIP